MNVAKWYQTIGKLRALVESPVATEAEATSARARMEEIEAKIRDAAKKEEESRPKEVTPRPKATVCDLSNKMKRKVGGVTNKIQTEWPFGWNKRETIDVDSVFFDLEKKIVLEWKCPDCGTHIVRTITPKHRAKLSGRPKGVKNFIDGIRQGKSNQLCDDCWKKHQ